MDKKIVYFFIAVSLNYISAEITINCEESVKKFFTDWEHVEHKLKNNLKPLEDLIKKVTKKKQVAIDLEFYDPVHHQGYDLILRTNPQCLRFKAHCTPYTSREKGNNWAQLAIEQITVEDTYQSKGIGKSCIQVFDNSEIAQALGYREILLDSMQEAKGFYANLGFTCTYEDEYTCLYSKRIK